MTKLLLRTALTLLLLLCTNHLRAQLVKDEFSQLAFGDNFDEDKGVFKSISNADNLFVIQDGEYLLRRKNTFSAYSVFPSWKNTLPAFRLTASMKLEDIKTDDASIGLIFMAQEDGSGAFIFEINPKGQYRLKQLVGVNFKLLTGEMKTGGWVSTTLLSPAGQFNLIDIKTAKKNYDIYINQKYLLSFTELAYKLGDIGIAIGPGTKAHIASINVYGPKEEAVKPPATATQGGTQNTNTQQTTQGDSPPKYDPGQGSTTDVIMKLVEQVSKLSMENQHLRDSLNLLKKQLQK